MCEPKTNPATPAPGRASNYQILMEPLNDNLFTDFDAPVMLSEESAEHDAHEAHDHAEESEGSVYTDDPVRKIGRAHV